MAARTPISLSLDVDDNWVYLKVRALDQWRARPTYLPVFVPRILEFLRQRGLTITFFIVGEDAANEARGPLLRSLAEAGHEIANHSFSHEPWIDPTDARLLACEVARAEEAIEAATGQRPVGYRGPGFLCSEALLRILHERGYEYDASLFPTFAGPLARLAYLGGSRMSGEERKRRAALFGPLRAGLWPLGGFRWELHDGQGIVEVPVTTLPFLRLPIHLSYVMALAEKSPRAALAYARFALRLCRATGVEPSLLLHPLDFLSLEDAPDLSFFRGMNVEPQVKLRVLDGIFDTIARDFEPMTVLEHTRRMAQSPTCRTRTPRIL